MPVYLAKFPDGTVQIASAKNKGDLMRLLDQVGCPTRAQIKPLNGLEWIIEAEPVSAQTESIEDDPYQLIDFKLRVASCDAGHYLEHAISEAFPKISQVNMGGLSFQRAKEWDKTAQLHGLGWKPGPVPEYDTPDPVQEMFINDNRH